MRPARANVVEIRDSLMEMGYTYDQANFVIRYTAQDADHPNKEWKTPDSDGFITLRYRGLSRFELEDHREFPRKPLATQRRMAYTRKSREIPARKHAVHPRREPPMPPARGRRAAAPAPAPAPAPEPEENGQVDFQKYLDKELSPTMTDYVTWFEDNVAALEEVPVDKLLVLGSSLYPHFQKSEFNINRREARRAGRAEAEPEPEPEPEPVKPARGRPRGRAAAPAPEPAPAPARRGRGRPAKAGAEAPY